MKPNKMQRVLAIAASLAFAGLGIASAAPAVKVFGKTYGEWSAGWWQWQEANYPDFDFGEGMVDCSLGQSGPVWYLGGSFSTDPVRRECVEPLSRNIRLFIPLVNAADFDDESSCESDPCTVEEQREILDGLLSEEPAGLFTSVGCDLQIAVDGVPAVFSTPIVRTQSPPFEYAGNPENVADGFWVMLDPLPPGEHLIEFTGGLCDIDTALSDPDQPTVFGVDVTYVLTVR